MNSFNVKKTLVGAMALSLMMSACLLIDNERAAASSSTNLMTQSQSAERYASLKELQNHWRNEGRELRKAGPHIMEEAAQILQIDKAELTKLLQDGKSIVEIAEERGLTEESLAETLMKARSTKLDTAVAEGKLTQQRADMIKAKMESHIGYKLNQKGYEERPDKKEHDRHHTGLPHLKPDKLSSLLGISRDQLIEELKSGKSIAEVAEENGISKQELISKIKDELTPALEEIIEEKISRSKKSE